MRRKACCVNASIADRLLVLDTVNNEVAVKIGTSMRCTVKVGAMHRGEEHWVGYSTVGVDDTVVVACLLEKRNRDTLAVLGVSGMSIVDIGYSEGKWCFLHGNPPFWVVIKMSQENPVLQGGDELRWFFPCYLQNTHVLY